jgi:hypothetical protein
LAIDRLLANDGEFDLDMLGRANDTQLGFDTQASTQSAEITTVLEAATLQVTNELRVVTREVGVSVQAMNLIQLRISNVDVH